MVCDKNVAGVVLAAFVAAAVGRDALLELVTLYTEAGEEYALMLNADQFKELYKYVVESDAVGSSR